MTENSSKVTIDKQLLDYPVFDCKFKVVDWQLDEDNIEARREDIDFFGVIVIRAVTEYGDFKTRVISGCDIADGLYDAMEEAEEFLEDGWDSVEVWYTTECCYYGAGKTYQMAQEIGCVLCSMLGCDNNWYDYPLGKPAICRASGQDWEEIWMTDEFGYYDKSIDIDIDALIAHKSNPEAFQTK